MIAFFGMGLLGSNFVRALRERGETVHVWNRTAARASALAGPSVTSFTDPAEAVRGATRVHLTLSDDAAVDDVLERARPGFAPGVVLVDHSTTSATGTAARAARWRERGVAFVHAPVFMGPQNAREATGVMLVSGPADLITSVTPALSAMTGKLVPVGEAPERAAGLKLIGNLFIMSLTAGMVDCLALAGALGIDAGEVTGLFEVFNPGASAVPRLRRLLAADYDHPSWELAMARKDARLMADEARRAGDVPFVVVPGLVERMDRMLARGHGHDDWTVIAKDIVAPAPSERR